MFESEWDGSCLCEWQERGMRGLGGYKNNPECEWLETGLRRLGGYKNNPKCEWLETGIRRLGGYKNNPKCEWLETDMRRLDGYKNNPKCKWLEMGTRVDNNAGINLAVCASGLQFGSVRTCVVDAMFYYIISFMADHEISALDS